MGTEGDAGKQVFIVRQMGGINGNRGDPGIKQGYLEKSNVGNTEEMIKMIETFRAYESVQKAIQSIGEMISKMVNDPGLIW